MPEAGPSTVSIDRRVLWLFVLLTAGLVAQTFMQAVDTAAVSTLGVGLDDQDGPTSSRRPKRAPRDCPPAPAPADAGPAGRCPGAAQQGEGCWDWTRSGTSASASKGYAAKYGFYIHVFDQPAAVIHQVNQIHKYFPGSPIYIMSDGGDRFDGLCLRRNCSFKLCPPANDRWHPWPFMHRMRTAAIEMNAEYLVYLEPDNTIHRGITHEPDSDAGGMRDNNPRFGAALVKMVEEHVRKQQPTFEWGYHGSGLAGGSYFKTSVIMDAFSDDKVANIPWAELQKHDSKRIFSSDFAMPIALSWAGYQYKPWPDIIQWDMPDQPNVTEYAFEHYSRGVKGGKPEYKAALEGWREELLCGPALEFFKRNKVVCQLCWNITWYVEHWGTTDCANPHPTPHYTK